MSKCVHFYDEPVLFDADPPSPQEEVNALSTHLYAADEGVPTSASSISMRPMNSGPRRTLSVPPPALGEACCVCVVPGLLAPEREYPPRDEGCAVPGCAVPGVPGRAVPAVVPGLLRSMVPCEAPGLLPLLLW